jgi:hypothetical protein
VNLAPYSVRRYSNGSRTVVEEERLIRRNSTANTINSRATFVLANGEATLPNILSAANQLSAGYQTAGPSVILLGGVTYFNGDDAMALVRYPSGTAGVGPGVIGDLIGVIGEQPLLANGNTGGNWSGTNTADGATPPLVSSANQSIIRRSTVSRGVRYNPTPQNVPGSNPPVRQTGGYNIASE